MGARARIVCGAAAATLLLAVLIRALDPLTAPRLAYLYHPGSDDLYVATLLPDLGEFENWRKVTPYRAQLFGDFIQIEYRGRLAAQRAVARGGAWRAAERLRPSETGDAVEVYIVRDPERSRRADLAVADLLPAAWQALDAHPRPGSDEVIAVDLVVVRRAPGATLRTEMYPGALFVQGAAADAVWRMGYD